MRIILASQSPRRAQALKTLGFPFETVPPSFEESLISESDPSKLVKKLSLEKARVVAKKYPEALVIGGEGPRLWFTVGDP